MHVYTVHVLRVDTYHCARIVEDGGFAGRVIAPRLADIAFRPLIECFAQCPAISQFFALLGGLIATLIRSFACLVANTQTMRGRDLRRGRDFGRGRGKCRHSFVPRRWQRFFFSGLPAKCGDNVCLGQRINLFVWGVCRVLAIALSSLLINVVKFPLSW